MLTANRFWTQERNRRDALERLDELIRQAATPPKVRRPTNPSRASRQRRLDGKRRHSDLKKTRGEVGLTDRRIAPTNLDQQIKFNSSGLRKKMRARHRPK